MPLPHAVPSVVLLCALTSGPAIANGWPPDPLYGNAGKTLVDFGAFPVSNDTPAAVAAVGDGRIVVAGTVDAAPPFTPQTDTRVGLLRLTADGDPDPSFGGGDGRVTLPVPFAPGRYLARAVAVDGTGRSVVAGNYRAPGATVNRMFVLRVLADGSGLDAQFSSDGVATFDLGTDFAKFTNAVAVQPDGRIVIAGHTRLDLNNQWATVVRLTADGSLDTSFSLDGAASFPLDIYPDDDVRFNEINALALQSDGKIVIAGGSSGAPVNGGPFGDIPAAQNRAMVVARLLSDGTLDPTFGPTAQNSALRRGFNSAGNANYDDDVAMAVTVSELFSQPGSRRIVLGGRGRDHSTGNHFAQFAAFTDDGLHDLQFINGETRYVGLVVGNSDQADAEIRAISTRVIYRLVNGYLRPERKIVFAGHVLDLDERGPRQFFVGQWNYAPDQHHFVWNFTRDYDGDGTPNEVGTSGMAVQGNKAIVAGFTPLRHRDGSTDRDFVVFRYPLDY